VWEAALTEALAAPGPALAEIMTAVELA